MAKLETIKTNDTHEYVFASKIKSAGYKHEDNTTEVYCVFRPLVDLSEVLEETFAKSSAKYTPNWYKEDREYVTAKSKFKVKVMLDFGDNDKEVVSFEEWCEMGTRGADAVIKIKACDGAVYLNAVRVLSAGEEYDPFSDMM